jgi:type IV pilus assembly protein PilB
MDAGLVTEQQLRAALSEQRKWGGRLGHTLVQLGFVDEQAMVAALSRQLHLPVVDLDKAELAKELASHLRYETAERYGVCPLQVDARSRMLRVATSDPTNAEVSQALTFQTGMKLELVVASAGSIDRALRRLYGRERRPSLPPAPAPAVLQEKLEALAARIAELESKVAQQAQLVRELLARGESAHADRVSDNGDEQADRPPAS